jgi:Spy/CpxP family protein refolding chaperone
MTASSATLRHVSRPKQLAALFLVGAFVVGALCGFAVDRAVGDRLVAGPAVGGPPPPANVLDAFSAELGLTPTQRAAVDSIMDERHRIIDSLLRPVRPQITAARESARRQIRQRLTPDQERRFDAYLARTAAAGKPQ